MRVIRVGKGRGQRKRRRIFSIRSISIRSRMTGINIRAIDFDLWLIVLIGFYFIYGNWEDGEY